MPVRGRGDGGGTVGGGVPWDRRYEQLLWVNHCT